MRVRRGLQIILVFVVIVAGLNILAIYYSINNLKLHKVNLKKFYELQQKMLIGEELKYNIANLWQYFTDASLTKEKETISKEAKPILDTIFQDLDKLKKLYKNDFKTLDKLNLIEEKVKIFWNTGQKMFFAYLKDWNLGNKVMTDFDKASEELISMVESLVKTEERQCKKFLQKMLDQATLQEVRSKIAGLGMLVFAIFGIIGVYYIFFVVRSVVLEIKNSAEVVAGSSKELKSSTNEIAEKIKISEARTSQIASATEEMSVGIADIARSSEEISRSSKATVDVAIEGKQVVEGTSKEIEAIAEVNNRLKEVIAEMYEKSRSIEGIVAFIKDVAEQTNLLALNATIEAARAGEHGKSFAVVAGEIRKLAERTNRSTDDISEIILEIQKAVNKVKEVVESVSERVESGVKLSSEANEVLDTIFKEAESLQEKINGIVSVIQQMSTTSQQISEDIREIAEATKEISKKAEESLGTVEKIANSGEVLGRVITKL
ncbi:MAG: methyl-accepting chemotaxis protein [Thermodesulfobacteria bacterium]|nr:methyl-accepting chemotaxis protein [Thermodesulfobacteriota bacterium]